MSLMDAQHCTKPKVVELLLRARANPNLQDKVMMGVYLAKQGAVQRASAS